MSSDLIDRQAAIDAVDKIIERDESGNNDVVKAMNAWKVFVEGLPPTQPYTDEEIQKMQDMESAEIEKAFELGREDAMAEIVRCKDCIRYHQPSCLMAYDGKEWSEDDGFCHVGEREEDGF